MSKKELIEKTIAALEKLHADKVVEVSDFADFILDRYDTKQMTDGIAQLSKQSKSYDFLNEEEDIYTLNDVKIPFIVKRKN